MNPRVTKGTFLNALACPTFVWFQRHASPAALSPGAELRILEGKEIGELARRTFPGGVLVDDRDLQVAAERTRALMMDPNVTVIFEATFIAEPFVTRADVLLRDKDAWTLVEVKSSRDNESDIEDHHVSDLAYTAMILRFAGITPARIELMRISREWRGGESEPFIRCECMASVTERTEKFAELSKQIAYLIQSQEKPEGKLTMACKGCEFFSSQCVG